MIRLHVDGVTSMSRNTMGVRIIDLDTDDQVGSIGRVEAEQAAQPESPSP
jgi:DNA gyrase/topoisomerase IV subunit A